MSSLRYQNAEGGTVVHRLTGETVIGRRSNCDVILPSPIVSRQHARLFQRDGAWFVADLGSRRGTVVNGQVVTEHQLRPGDTLDIVGHTITFIQEDTLRSTPATDTIPGDFRPDEPTDPGKGGPEREPEILTELEPERVDLVHTFNQTRKLAVNQLLAEPQRLLADLAAAPVAARGQTAVLQRRSVEDPAAAEREVAGRLLALVRISDELRRCADEDAVGRTAVEMALQVTGSSRGVLALRQPNGAFEARCQLGADGAEEIRISQTFVDRVVRRNVALVALDTDQDLGLAAAKSVMAMAIRSILCVPLQDEGNILGYLYLDSTAGARRFGKTDLDFVTALGHQAAAEIGRLRLASRFREEQERRRNLGRFLSADVIQHIEDEALAGRLAPAMSMREQEVTVLFADIQGFTSMSERLSPAEVKLLLDAYFDRMTQIIVDRHRGTLDKYIGDAIMALFGAPFSDGTTADALRAVTAAVEMRNAAVQLRQELDVELQIRIGINTGKVVAGMVGSTRRMEYTVIGDAVNVASRLESTGLPNTIQIGEATYDLIRERFECHSAGSRKVKNRQQPVNAWWVIKPL